MCSTTTSAGETPDDPSRLLVLMRHAKSGWAEDGLSDHDRPLNRHGRSDAPTVADWLCRQGFDPEVVLCSSAVRTCETAELMGSRWERQPTRLTRDSLYLASPESILGVIRSDACDCQRLLVIAHNPGISHLASSLSGQRIEMSTAAVAVFRIRVDWPHFRSPDQAELIQFMQPKTR